MTQAIMQKSTGVLITAFLCATIIVVAFIGALVFIAIKHADPATLLSLIATLVSIYNIYLLRDQRTAINQIQSQTNGAQTAMIQTQSDLMNKMSDAVISTSGATTPQNAVTPVAPSQKG